MRKSHAIKWEEFPYEFRLLDDFQIPIFEKYFLGKFTRDGNTMTDTILGLNDFLRSLTKQELDIFLNLKGNYGREYINDKTFIEILNYCLPRTNANIQRPLIIAMNFIIDRHEPSRDKLMTSTESLERIANTESKNKTIAINILSGLNENYTPPVNRQYIFKPNETYTFFKEFREIIKNAKNYIYYIDNYANHLVLDYIIEYCDLSKIREIKILTLQNIDDLNLSKLNFDHQYTHINLEIKSTKKYHDRYLFFENEQWFLGPSIKDGGRKVCSIVQLKEESAHKAVETFNQIWSEAVTI